MDKREIEKTIQSLEKRLSQRPPDPETLHQLAELYYQIGRFDTIARDVYEQVIKEDPKEVKFHKALSISLLLEQVSQIPQEIQEITESDRQVIYHSIEHLQLMSERQPENVTIRQALANLLLFIGEVDKAIEHYKLCLQFGFPQVSAVRQFFESAYSSDIEFTTSQLLFFAEIFMKTGEYELASKILLDLYKKGETSSRVIEPLIELLELFVNELMDVEDEKSVLLRNEYLRLLTDIHLQRNELLNALQTMSMIDLTKLQDYSTVKRVAETLIRYGDFRGAFDLLSKTPLDEEAKALINQMTLHLEKRGELDTATYLLHFINQNDITIKEISQQRWRQLELRAEIGLANLYFKKKNYKQALEKYLAVIKQGLTDIDEFAERLDYIMALHPPDDPEVFKRLAFIYLQKKNYYKAAHYYQAVLERQPDERESRQRLREIYNQILSKAPQLGEIRIKSGDLYMLEGDLENALSEYREAANNPLSRIKANKKVAEIYFKTGNLTLALDMFKELPIEEGDLEDLYSIMQALVNNEDFASAQVAAELILGVNPGYRDTAEVLESLRSREREHLGINAQGDEMQALIGEHSVGRYQLIRKIASGGMGVIYKVYDKKLGKCAAMKILREELSGSDRALERFFREARIAASIKHPNIVDIYDFNISHTAGQSFISMEYIEGRSLREIIEEKFAFSPEPTPAYMAQILYYMSQLCSVLEATHKKGIIHRDIKPDNIMITQDDVVKITDFGIVHIEKATFTPTGALIGTPRYMSPEQVRGGKIDGRADIYAVGIVMYECLLGSPPFIAGDIAYQQVNVVPPQPREIMPIIPESVNAIIMKCLQKNPDKRYQTATQLKKVIDKTIEELVLY
ncbi:protein kinase [Candidatus Sumerlaeota bacterium]|nr:protein kinase [Candidatus Sumerlaeota bacterium]